MRRSGRRIRRLFTSSNKSASVNLEVKAVSCYSGAIIRVWTSLDSTPANLPPNPLIVSNFFQKLQAVSGHCTFASMSHLCSLWTPRGKIAAGLLTCCRYGQFFANKNVTHIVSVYFQDPTAPTATAIRRAFLTDGTGTWNKRKF